MMRKLRKPQHLRGARHGVTGLAPSDYQATAEGAAIKRLLAMVPSVRVIHDSILWNKRTARKDVRRMYEQTTLARLMFNRFFSRSTKHGRKYREYVQSADIR